MCVRSVTRKPLFIGGPRDDQTTQLHLSVLDKRLYMLLKGIIVTPRFVRASSFSSHSRASFTCGAFGISFVRRPLHVWHAYVLRCSSDKVRATEHAAPSARKRPTTPLCPWGTSVAPQMICSRPASERFLTNGGF
jgi:hypothetical protein